MYRHSDSSPSEDSPFGSSGDSFSVDCWVLPFGSSAVLSAFCCRVSLAAFVCSATSIANWCVQNDCRCCNENVLTVCTDCWPLETCSVCCIMSFHLSYYSAHFVRCFGFDFYFATAVCFANSVGCFLSVDCFCFGVGYYYCSAQQTVVVCFV